MIYVKRCIKLIDFYLQSKTCLKNKNLYSAAQVSKTTYNLRSFWHRRSTFLQIFCYLLCPFL